MIKTRSIKRDLVITLSVLVAVILICLRLLGFAYERHHNREELDANLVKSSKLIFSVIKHDVFERHDLKYLQQLKIDFQQKIYHRYEYKIHAQAWEGDKLVYNSDNFLLVNKPDYEGFKDVVIDQTTWRTFSFYDAKSKILILVAEQDFVSNSLTFRSLFSFILPLVLSFSLLFVAIVVTVNRKLKPFGNLARQIETMSANSLQQFHNNNIPLELKPFIDSFNALIERLVISINSERNFTNYAAHELKTPLAAIGVQAHLLINNKNKDKDQEYSQDLLNGIARATHLINQLLTLSRIESDRINVEKQKVDLEQLTHLTIASYEIKAAEKNLVIEFDQQKDVKKIIFGNRTYLEIVVSNLLDNAIKYSSFGDVIKIELQRDNGSIIFKITNPGEKILDAEIDKIFSNFYRINRLESKKSNIGCGLGLAIAKKIIDIHQASISFHSEAGKNSVVIIFPEI